MSKKNATTTTTNTQATSTQNAETRQSVEVLVDELLEKVMGGEAEASTLCQHCNQPCGDCTQT